MASSIELAKYFLRMADPEDKTTNLKLQKLCSYAQALSLAILDRPLFDEPLQARTHGPVILEVYKKYQDFGRNPIPTPTVSKENINARFTSEERFILEIVLHYYGQYSASKLEYMSHEDFPVKRWNHQIINLEDVKLKFRENHLVKKIQLIWDNIARESSRGLPELLTHEEMMDALET